MDNRERGLIGGAAIFFVVVLFVLFALPLQVQATVPDMTTAYLTSDPACIEDTDYEEYELPADNTVDENFYGLSSSVTLCSVQSGDLVDPQTGELPESESSSNKISVINAFTNDMYSVSLGL